MLSTRPDLTREAKDSSEIENIVTTQDRLYRALAASSSAAVDASTKEVMQYRSAPGIGEALVREHGFLSGNHIIRIQTEIIGNDAGLRRLLQRRSDQSRRYGCPPLSV